MTIADWVTGGKEGASTEKGGLAGEWLIVAVVALASSASFGLGMLADREMKPAPAIQIKQLEQTAGLGSAAAADAATAPNGPTGQGSPASTGSASSGIASSTIPAGGQYVASKTGTKFYLPWCATAARILPANQVWFASETAAEAAGYGPASNCKGL